MTTAESNKIINKWMWRIAPQFEPESQQPDYSSDWNALMKVVECIEQCGYTVEIRKSWCQISIPGRGFNQIAVYPSTIKSVYEICLSFIQWYNEQTKIQ